MESRTQLKELYQQRLDLMRNMSALTEEYIQECGDKPLLYITEHAIVRYLERMKGYTFDESLKDVDKLATIEIPPERVREMMLTHDEQKAIVAGMKSVYTKDGAKYVIKNLSVITTIKIK